MKVSNEFLETLADWEGFELKPYKDVAGYITIGVGHLLKSSEKSTGMLDINGQQVPWKDGITKEECLELLKQDLHLCENILNTSLKVKLNQDQYDAIISFIFNVGGTNFKNSTLLKVLNKRLYSEVPIQLSKWNRAGGKIVKGLINRRNKEIDLWNGRK